MSKSSKVVGGGTSAAATTAAPEVLAASTHVEEGEGGTPLEDAPLGLEGSALK